MRQAFNRWWETYWPLVYTGIVIAAALGMIAYAVTLDLMQP